MKYKKSLTFLLCGIAFSICVGQSTKEKGFCDRSWCKLPKNHPYHFDPYYNGHLCENFNPEQIDFSKEYFDLQTKLYSKQSNEIKKALKSDFSSIWLTEESQQDGIIGLNYQRIQIHINKVSKTPNPDIYLIEGKSKVKSNICDFKGELKLELLFHKDCEDNELSKCAELFGSYVLYEDSMQNHSGYFKGIMECAVYFDKITNSIRLDESMNIADGYWNRTFVGTWTEYNSKKSKKCIWGDYRLPFTFDFDCGDGEMRACEKYEKNGWKEFNDHSELIEVKHDKWELKNKWWKIK